MKSVIPWVSINLLTRIARSVNAESISKMLSLNHPPMPESTDAKLVALIASDCICVITLSVLLLLMSRLLLLMFSRLEKVASHANLNQQKEDKNDTFHVEASLMQSAPEATANTLHERVTQVFDRVEDTNHDVGAAVRAGRTHGRNRSIQTGPEGVTHVKSTCVMITTAGALKTHAKRKRRVMSGVTDMTSSTLASRKAPESIKACSKRKPRVRSRSPERSPEETFEPADDAEETEEAEEPNTFSLMQRNNTR